VRIDPLDALGIVPDQHGRRWDGDDGESKVPPDPGLEDLRRSGTKDPAVRAGQCEPDQEALEGDPAAEAGDVGARVVGFGDQALVERSPQCSGGGVFQGLLIVSWVLLSGRGWLVGVAAPEVPAGGSELVLLGGKEWRPRSGARILWVSAPGGRARVGRGGPGGGAMPSRWRQPHSASLRVPAGRPAAGVDPTFQARRGTVMERWLAIASVG